MLVMIQVWMTTRVCPLQYGMHKKKTVTLPPPPRPLVPYRSHAPVEEEEEEEEEEEPAFTKITVTRQGPVKHHAN